MAFSFVWKDLCLYNYSRNAQVCQIFLADITFSDTFASVTTSMRNPSRLKSSETISYVYRATPNLSVRVRWVGALSREPSLVKTLIGSCCVVDSFRIGLGWVVPPEWEFVSEVREYERRPACQIRYDHEGEVTVIR